MKRSWVFNLLLIFTFGLSGCGTPPATYETGPQLEIDLDVVELSIQVTMDSDGDVVLGGDFSLSTLGPVGVGWTAGFEKVLYEAQRDEPALFILWEDPSGEIWREKYIIGQPFSVTFDNDQWVREIKSVDKSIIVAVEPVESAPEYSDLQEDVRSLVERWDVAHYYADRYWDTGELSSVLSGAALEEQLDTVDFLKSNNCYWEIYELMTPKIIYFEAVGTRSLIVDVRKNWDMDLYCNGQKDKDDDGYFTMRYNIDEINGAWFITEKRVIARQ